MTWDNSLKARAMRLRITATTQLMRSWVKPFYLNGFLKL